MFKMEPRHHTIVIGGGAAGLMAAVSAARQGRTVLVIEKNESIGRKILVTGNGRCNLTNTDISPASYYGDNTKCLHSIFSRFSGGDAMAFFEGLGVKLKTEEDGKVFPVSDRAATVVDAFARELGRLKVAINLNERVTELVRDADGWSVTSDKGVYRAGHVVLAAGGRSYPQLGTTGDGFELAGRLGHRIIRIRPGLVPLELDGDELRELQGVKAEAEITIEVKGKTVARKSGEMLFTHYGISGPLVLDLSRLILDCAGKPGNTVVANFFPGYDSPKLAWFLTKRWQSYSKKTLANSFIGLLPKQLCLTLLAQLEINPGIRCAVVTKTQAQLMADKLTGLKLIIRQPRPYAESMVTAGGVALDEVNTRTMESLKAKGLYLAGEVLDIDGISGGYNLQFAWSTGHLAGLGLQVRP